MNKYWSPCQRTIAPASQQATITRRTHLDAQLTGINKSGSSATPNTVNPTLLSSLLRCSHEVKNHCPYHQNTSATRCFARNDKESKLKLSGPFQHFWESVLPMSTAITLTETLLTSSQECLPDRAALIPWFSNFSVQNIYPKGLLQPNAALSPTTSIPDSVGLGKAQQVPKQY